MKCSGIKRLEVGDHLCQCWVFVWKKCSCEASLWYIIGIDFEGGFETELMTVIEGEAIIKLGNFASWEQQHSTHAGVLRVTILETWRGDVTESQKRP